MVVTARLLNRIDHLEEKIKDLQTNLKDICKDINYVERTIMNKINTVDEVHTKVEEEIKAAQRKFHLSNVRSRKERVLIACEVAKLAMEENLVDIAFKAATLAIVDDWDA
jgi:peptidoglycan hydrolase CwlO-like protein